MTTNNRSFNLKLNFQVNPGFSIVCVIITIILISLKLLGVLSVSWLAATALVWIWFALAFALLLGFLLWYLLAYIGATLYSLFHK